MNAFSAIRPSSNNPKDSKVVKLLGTSEPLGDGKIEQHFQLDRRPFSSIPDTEEYFAAATIENARSSIVRQILREEGPAFVVGTVGIGKTLLSHLLEDALIHHCRVIKMTSGRLSTRRALLQVMLYELGLSYHGLDEGEARLALIDYVTSAEHCPEGILLLVDEAEDLRMPLLDELRMMTNLMANNHPCIRLVLIGDRRLEEKFAHPKLESFNQRITGRYYLERMTKEEVRGYVRSIVIRAGGNADQLYAEEAYNAIYQATEGIPRLINQLCGHALVLVAASKGLSINANDIAEAWADLQQLPMPQTTQFIDSGNDESAVVEFGELDEIVESDSDRRIVPDQENSPPETPSLSTNELFTETPDPSLVDSEVTENSGEQPTESVHLEIDADKDATEELLFHDAHSTLNPFEEHFAEEEVVIDNFLKPNILADKHSTVTCDESQQLIEQLSNVLRHASSESNEALDTAQPNLDDWDETDEMEDGDDDVQLNLITFVAPSDEDDAGILDEYADSTSHAPPADDTSLESWEEELDSEDSTSTVVDDTCEDNNNGEDLANENSPASLTTECDSAPAPTDIDGDSEKEEEPIESSALPNSGQSHYRNLFTRLRRSS